MNGRTKSPQMFSSMISCTSKALISTLWSLWIASSPLKTTAWEVHYGLCFVDQMRGIK